MADEEAKAIPHNAWNAELDTVARLVGPAIEQCRAGGVSLQALHYGLYVEMQKLSNHMSEDLGLRRTSPDLFGTPEGWA